MEFLNPGIELAVGLEHFPKEGGVLLCSNHIHNFDPLVVGIMAPRPVHFMAKEEIFKVPVLGNIVKGAMLSSEKGEWGQGSIKNRIKALKRRTCFWVISWREQEVKLGNWKRVVRSRFFCIKV